MPVQIVEHQFDTGVVKINYHEGPASGPPLVLLHGGSGRWQGSEAIIPDLAADWHIYAPDFRGHGRSGRVPGRYLLQDYVDDMLVFLREVVGEAAYLFGHSLGGQVALMAAAQGERYVRAVVVGDSPLTRLADRSGRGDSGLLARVSAWRDLAGGRLSVEEIIEALKDAPTEVPGHDEPVTMREKYGEEASVFAWIATNLYYNDPDMLTAVLDGSFDAGYDVESVLPPIRCPVLLLQADPAAGGMMTDAEVERALDLLERPSHVRLDGVSHVLPNEPVLQAITGFLTSLRAS